MNRLIISPDRKTAYTLNQAGELINSSDIYEFVTTEKSYGIRAAAGNPKILEIPGNHSDLPWLQDSAPLDFSVADCRKIG